VLEAGGTGAGAARIANPPPAITSANPNAPGVMIGEFAARLIVSG
jgi:hypothetical protein